MSFPLKMNTLKFSSPTTIMISGPTGSGKSWWLHKLLKHKNELFENIPQKIMYCFGEWQALFDTMEAEMDIIFHEGIPTPLEIDTFSNENHQILIIDDLQNQAASCQTVELLFTRTSHHKNLTVIYLVQNLFNQGKCARNISLNCHYIILFKNLRDKTQISNFAKQLGMSSIITPAYNDATLEPYNPLIVDLAPKSDDQYRVRSNIFPDQYPIIYQ